MSTGNRGRATSASEVIEVAGSNHAIGVILNLAWGPNNFSPSMIWSWRTRSNSQTGLGVSPWNSHFVFAFFCILSIVIIIFIVFLFCFVLFFFLFLLFFRAIIFLKPRS